LKWTTLEVELGDIGAYLLLLQDEANVLIDAGPANNVERDLPKKLKDLSVKEIDYLILTHGHTDHIGGARWIKEHYGSTIIAHPDTVKFLVDPSYELNNYWLKYLKFFKDSIRDEFEKGYWKTRGRDSCEVDKTVREGEILNVGSLRFKFLETPGHIDGSLSIQEEKARILFVGDAIQGLGPCSSIIQAIPLYFNVKEYIESLEKITKSDVKRLISAHPYKPLCKPIQSKIEAKKLIEASVNFVKSFESSMLEMILREKRGVTFRDLGQKLSRKFGSEWPSIGLAPTIWSHIERMVERGRVEICESPHEILIIPKE